ncbi:RNA/RNP complex-1-interacting phosphatase homolog [Clavelina lepadiformis]|uniref:RNA/RNP complex-1-interacting phosphatase homolog n=1 Tax=Clavelina lepadiformis TaxID=159417 RepID=UPI0040423206
MPHKHNHLPEGWLDYSKMGKIVENSRFLAVKVPLKKRFYKDIPEDEHFSPNNLIQMAEERNIKIGLIVDLTFTRKYYDPRDFTDYGMKYVKIMVPGRVIPDNQIIMQFFSAIKEFEKENKDNDNVIVVHCTHGLNRTGYFVCKYLIKEKRIQPSDAINMFNAARGHKIERENYLNDLHSSSEKIDSDHIQEHTNKMQEFPQQRATGYEFWDRDIYRDPHCQRRNYHNEFSEYSSRQRPPHGYRWHQQMLQDRRQYYHPYYPPRSSFYRNYSYPSNFDYSEPNFYRHPF